MYKPLTGEEYDREFLEAKQSLAVARYENFTVHDNSDNTDIFDTSSDDIIHSDTK